MEKLGQTQLAYEDIKNMLLKNKLSPGTFVSEVALQNTLPYGRTPIREAFIRLSCEGLVNIHPRKGIEVANVSPRKLYDIYEIRQFVEPSFVQENFETLDKETLSAYYDRFTDSQQYLKNGKEDGVYLATQVDLEFHLALLSSSGNAHYKEMLKSFFDYMTMVRVAVTFNHKRFRDGLSEHKEIIDAIMKDDMDLTISLLREHLQASYFSIMRDFSLF